MVEMCCSACSTPLLRPVKVTVKTAGAFLLGDIADPKVTNRMTVKRVSKVGRLGQKSIGWLRQLRSPRSKHASSTLSCSLRSSIHFNSLIKLGLSDAAVSIKSEPCTLITTLNF